MTSRHAVGVIDGTFVDDEVSAPMEPCFETDPRPADVAEASRRREPLFHREAVGVSHANRLRGTTPADLDEIHRLEEGRSRQW